jgi:glycosyltransferase involved in cell wall biosynthesis
MTSSPPVSIILPVYNGEAFLPDALKALNDQAYPALEIIVVDDGSTDGTAAIVKQHPHVQYLYQPNAGPAAARNTGIRHSTTELLGFLDVDDRLPAGKIKWQVDYLHAHPDLEVVMGGIKYVLLDGAKITDSPFEDPNEMRAFVNLGAGLFRRSVFDRIRLFAEDLRYSEDVDWFLRALEQDILLTIVKEPGLLYQRHPASMTAQAGDDRMRMSFLRALRRSMERRRQPDGTISRLPDWASFFEDELKALARKGPDQGLYWKDQ